MKENEEHQKVVPEGHEVHARAADKTGDLGFAVVTLSDTRTAADDVSGRYLQTAIAAAGHRVEHYCIVKDEPDDIREQLEITLNNPDVAIVVTNGGTGIAARDTAFETVVGTLEKRLDGFGELFRMLSYEEIGAAAMLSRAVGGITMGKVIFSLPGATNAVKLGMEKLILPQVGHLYYELHKHD